MAWIQIIDEDEATGELKAIYDDLTQRRGKMSNIMRVHSLHPAAMQAHMDLYLKIMFSRSGGLRRADRELLVGEPGLGREDAVVEPLQKLAAAVGGDRVDRRKVDVGVDEPGQQETAAVVDQLGVGGACRPIGPGTTPEDDAVITPH